VEALEGGLGLGQDASRAAAAGVGVDEEGHTAVHGGSKLAWCPAVRRSLLMLLTLAMVAAGCGSSDSKTSTASDAASPTTSSGCQRVPAPGPRPDGSLDRPSLRIDTGRRWTARLQTNCGDITIALDPKTQPKTVASFVALARRGFYDGLTIHRIAREPNGSDFVVQGGDPTGKGQGGPGYSVAERPPEDARYTRGVVAMAKTEVEPPGTSGSQFFIVTAEDAGLPPEYAILGRVTGGDAAVRRMAAASFDPRNGRPRAPIVIKKLTIGN
jgi:cyclophilin family peptidyl-prolyl cis-trans isomerase